MDASVNDPQINTDIILTIYGTRIILVLMPKA